MANDSHSAPQQAVEARIVPGTEVAVRLHIAPPPPPGPAQRMWLRKNVPADFAAKIETLTKLPVIVTGRVHDATREGFVVELDAQSLEGTGLRAGQRIAVARDAILPGDAAQFRFSAGHSVADNRPPAFTLRLVSHLTDDAVHLHKDAGWPVEHAFDAASRRTAQTRARLAAIAAPWPAEPLPFDGANITFAMPSLGDALETARAMLSARIPNLFPYATVFAAPEATYAGTTLPVVVIDRELADSGFCERRFQGLLDENAVSRIDLPARTPRQWAYLLRYAGPQNADLVPTAMRQEALAELDQAQAAERATRPAFSAGRTAETATIEAMATEILGAAPEGSTARDALGAAYASALRIAQSPAKFLVAASAPESWPNAQNALRLFANHAGWAFATLPVPGHQSPVPIAFAPGGEKALTVLPGAEGIDYDVLDVTVLGAKGDLKSAVASVHPTLPDALVALDGPGPFRHAHLAPLAAAADWGNDRTRAAFSAGYRNRYVVSSANDVDDLIRRSSSGRLDGDIVIDGTLNKSHRIKLLSGLKSFGGAIYTDWSGEAAAGKARTAPASRGFGPVAMSFSAGNTAPRAVPPNAVLFDGPGAARIAQASQALDFVVAASAARLETADGRLSVFAPHTDPFALSLETREAELDAACGSSPLRVALDAEAVRDAVSGGNDLALAFGRKPSIAPKIVAVPAGSAAARAQAAAQLDLAFGRTRATIAATAAAAAIDDEIEASLADQFAQAPAGDLLIGAAAKFDDFESARDLVEQGVALFAIGDAEPDFSDLAPVSRAWIAAHADEIARWDAIALAQRITLLSDLARVHLTSHEVKAAFSAGVRAQPAVAAAFGAALTLASPAAKADVFPVTNWWGGLAGTIETDDAKPGFAIQRDKTGRAIASFEQRADGGVDLYDKLPGDPARARTGRVDRAGTGGYTLRLDNTPVPFDLVPDGTGGYTIQAAGIAYGRIHPGQQGKPMAFSAGTALAVREPEVAQARGNGEIARAGQRAGWAIFRPETRENLDALFRSHVFSGPRGGVHIPGTLDLQKLWGVDANPPLAGFKLPPHTRIDGDLLIDCTAIDELPEGLMVGGDLFADWSHVARVGAGVTIGGTARFGNSRLADLPPDFRAASCEVAGTPMARAALRGYSLDRPKTTLGEAAKERAAKIRAWAAENPAQATLALSLAGAASLAALHGAGALGFASGKQEPVAASAWLDLPDATKIAIARAALVAKHDAGPFAARDILARNARGAAATQAAADALDAFVRRSAALEGSESVSTLVRGLDGDATLELNLSRTARRMAFSAGRDDVLRRDARAWADLDAARRAAAAERISNLLAGYDPDAAVERQAAFVHALSAAGREAGLRVEPDSLVMRVVGDLARAAPSAEIVGEAFDEAADDILRPRAAFSMGKASTPVVVRRRENASDAIEPLAKATAAGAVVYIAAVTTAILAKASGFAFSAGGGQAAAPSARRILTFDAKEVAELVAHAREGEPARDILEEAEQLPPKRGLLLVGDEGIYLAPKLVNAPRHPLAGQRAPNGVPYPTIKVAHADQANPLTMGAARAWDAKRALWGGDDGAETIDLDILETIVQSGNELAIVIGDDSFEILGLHPARAQLHRMRAAFSAGKGRPAGTAAKAKGFAGTPKGRYWEIRLPIDAKALAAAPGNPARTLDAAKIEIANLARQHKAWFVDTVDGKALIHAWTEKGAKDTLDAFLQAPVAGFLASPDALPKRIDPPRRGAAFSAGNAEPPPAGRRHAFIVSIDYDALDASTRTPDAQATRQAREDVGQTIRAKLDDALAASGSWYVGRDHQGLWVHALDEARAQAAMDAVAAADIPGFAGFAGGRRSFPVAFSAGKGLPAPEAPTRWQELDAKIERGATHVRNVVGGTVLAAFAYVGGRIGFEAAFPHGRSLPEKAAIADAFEAAKAAAELTQTLYGKRLQDSLAAQNAASDLVRATDGAPEALAQFRDAAAAHGETIAQASGHFIDTLRAIPETKALADSGLSHYFTGIQQQLDPERIAAATREAIASLDALAGANAGIAGDPESLSQALESFKIAAARLQNISVEGETVPLARAAELRLDWLREEAPREMPGWIANAIDLARDAADHVRVAADAALAKLDALVHSGDKLVQNLPELAHTAAVAGTELAHTAFTAIEPLRHAFGFSAGRGESQAIAMAAANDSAIDAFRDLTKATVPWLDDFAIATAVQQALIDRSRGVDGIEQPLEYAWRQMPRDARATIVKDHAALMSVVANASAHGDLDSAAAEIQDVYGVTTGDLGGVFFAGPLPHRRDDHRGANGESLDADEAWPKMTRLDRFEQLVRYAGEERRGRDDLNKGMAFSAGLGAAIAAPYRFSNEGEIVRALQVAIDAPEAESAATRVYDALGLPDLDDRARANAIEQYFGEIVTLASGAAGPLKAGWSGFDAAARETLLRDFARVCVELRHAAAHPDLDAATQAVRRMSGREDAAIANAYFAGPVHIPGRESPLDAIGGFKTVSQAWPTCDVATRFDHLARYAAFERQTRNDLDKGFAFSAGALRRLDADLPDISRAIDAALEAPSAREALVHVAHAAVPWLDARACSVASDERLRDLFPLPSGSASVVERVWRVLDAPRRRGMLEEHAALTTLLAEASAEPQLDDAMLPVTLLYQAGGDESARRAFAGAIRAGRDVPLDAQGHALRAADAWPRLQPLDRFEHLVRYAAEERRLKVDHYKPFAFSAGATMAAPAPADVALAKPAPRVDTPAVRRARGVALVALGGLGGVAAGEIYDAGERLSRIARVPSPERLDVLDDRRWQALDALARAAEAKGAVASKLVAKADHVASLMPRLGDKHALALLGDGERTPEMLAAVKTAGAYWHAADRVDLARSMLSSAYDRIAFDVYRSAEPIVAKAASALGAGAQWIGAHADQVLHALRAGTGFAFASGANAALDSTQPILRLHPQDAQAIRAAVTGGPTQEPAMQKADLAAAAGIVAELASQHGAAFSAGVAAGPVLGELLTEVDGEALDEYKDAVDRILEKKPVDSELAPANEAAAVDIRFQSEDAFLAHAEALHERAMREPVRAVIQDGYLARYSFAEPAVAGAFAGLARELLRSTGAAQVDLWPTSGAIPTLQVQEAIAGRPVGVDRDDIALDTELVRDALEDRDDIARAVRSAVAAHRLDGEPIESKQAAMRTELGYALNSLRSADRGDPAENLGTLIRIALSPRDQWQIDAALRKFAEAIVGNDADAKLATPEGRAERAKALADLERLLPVSTRLALLPKRLSQAQALAAAAAGAVATAGAVAAHQFAFSRGRTDDDQPDDELWSPSERALRRLSNWIVLGAAGGMTAMAASQIVGALENPGHVEAYKNGVASLLGMSFSAGTAAQEGTLDGDLAIVRVDGKDLAAIAPPGAIAILREPDRAAFLSSNDNAQRVVEHIRARAPEAAIADMRFAASELPERVRDEANPRGVFAHAAAVLNPFGAAKLAAGSAALGAAAVYALPDAVEGFADLAKMAKADLAALTDRIVANPLPELADTLASKAALADFAAKLDGISQAVDAEFGPQIAAAIADQKAAYDAVVASNGAASAIADLEWASKGVQSVTMEAAEAYAAKIADMPDIDAFLATLSAADANAIMEKFDVFGRDGGAFYAESLNRLLESLRAVEQAAAAPGLFVNPETDSFAIAAPQFADGLAIAMDGLRRSYETLEASQNLLTLELSRGTPWNWTDLAREAAGVDLEAALGRFEDTKQAIESEIASIVEPAAQPIATATAKAIEIFDRVAAHAHVAVVQAQDFLAQGWSQAAGYVGAARHAMGFSAGRAASEATPSRHSVWRFDVAHNGPDFAKKAMASGLGHKEFEGRLRRMQASVDAIASRHGAQRVATEPMRMTYQTASRRDAEMAMNDLQETLNTNPQWVQDVGGLSVETGGRARAAFKAGRETLPVDFGLFVPIQREIAELQDLGWPRNRAIDRALDRASDTADFFAEMAASASGVEYRERDGADILFESESIENAVAAGERMLAAKNAAVYPVVSIYSPTVTPAGAGRVKIKLVDKELRDAGFYERHMPWAVQEEDDRPTQIRDVDTGRRTAPEWAQALRYFGEASVDIVPPELRADTLAALRADVETTKAAARSRKPAAQQAAFSAGIREISAPPANAAYPLFTVRFNAFDAARTAKLENADYSARLGEMASRMDAIVAPSGARLFREDANTRQYTANSLQAAERARQALAAAVAAKPDWAVNMRVSPDIKPAAFVRARAAFKAGAENESGAARPGDLETRHLITIVPASGVSKKRLTDLAKHVGAQAGFERPFDISIDGNAVFQFTRPGMADIHESVIAEYLRSQGLSADFEIQRSTERVAPMPGIREAEDRIEALAVEFGAKHAAAAKAVLMAHDSDAMPIESRQPEMREALASLGLETKGVYDLATSEGMARLISLHFFGYGDVNDNMDIVDALEDLARAEQAAGNAPADQDARRRSVLRIAAATPALQKIEIAFAKAKREVGAGVVGGVALGMVGVGAMAASFRAGQQEIEADPDADLDTYETEEWNPTPPAQLVRRHVFRIVPLGSEQNVRNVVRKIERAVDSVAGGRPLEGRDNDGAFRLQFADPDVMAAYAELLSNRLAKSGLRKDDIDLDFRRELVVPSDGVDARDAAARAEAERQAASYDRAADAILRAHDRLGTPIAARQNAMIDAISMMGADGRKHDDKTELALANVLRTVLAGPNGLDALKREEIVDGFADRLRRHGLDPAGEDEARIRRNAVLDLDRTLPTLDRLRLLPARLTPRDKLNVLVGTLGVATGVAASIAPRVSFSFRAGEDMAKPYQLSVELRSGALAPETAEIRQIIERAGGEIVAEEGPLSASVAKREIVALFEDGASADTVRNALRLARREGDLKGKIGNVETVDLREPKTAAAKEVPAAPPVQGREPDGFFDLHRLRNALADLSRQTGFKLVANAQLYGGLVDRATGKRGPARMFLEFVKPAAGKAETFPTLRVDAGQAGKGPAVAFAPPRGDKASAQERADFTVKASAPEALALREAVERIVTMHHEREIEAPSAQAIGALIAAAAEERGLDPASFGVPNPKPVRAAEPQMAFRAGNGPIERPHRVRPAPAAPRTVAPAAKPAPAAQKTAAASVQGVDPLVRLMVACGTSPRDASETSAKVKAMDNATLVQSAKLMSDVIREDQRVLDAQGRTGSNVQRATRLEAFRRGAKYLLDEGVSRGIAMPALHETLAGPAPAMSVADAVAASKPKGGRGERGDRGR